MRKFKQLYTNTLPITDLVPWNFETFLYTPSTKKSLYPQAYKSASLNGTTATYDILELHRPSTQSLRTSIGKEFADKSKTM